MKKVFIDTSYLLALELANDKFHKISIDHWQSIQPSLPELVTTSYIFDEVVTFFNNRGYHAKAISVGNLLLQSPTVRLIHINDQLFYDGWTFFMRHHDKNYSLTDCLSFIIMSKLRIKTALSFDAHFKQAGFLIEP